MAMTEWFYCPTCDREFVDPHAEEYRGRVFGECECGTTVYREGAEAGETE